ncbi:MAG: EsaB/YukD family protein, partial [Candidatus Dormibacteraeota bacterium]|nr:EsaB/YukD family protein [Candidatus Dormibacteraeota bacterium]
MTAVRHLTIVGRRRADLALPATIPIVQLVPRLVQLVDEESSGALYLARPTGERLMPDRSLTELGIQDGELLLLRGEEEAATPPVIDDWVGAVRRSTETGRGRWTASMGRDLTLAAAATGIAAAGGWAGVSHLPGVALALALGLLVVAACLDRIPGVGWPAIACAALALPVAGMAAGALAPGTVAAGGASVVGLRTVAVGVAGVAAVLATPSLSAPFAGAALAALPVGATALLVGSGHGTPAQGAVVLSIFWVLVVWRLPGLVVALLGWRWRPSAGDAMVGLEAVGHRIAWGRSLLSWLMTGAGVGQLVSLLVLSRAAGVFPTLLIVALGLAMLLRARHHHFAGEVAPLLLLALAALALLEVRLVAGSLALGIAVALASSVAIAVVGWLARFALGSVFVRRG